MIIFIAFFAMVFQDIMEVLKDQSQARNKAFLAGLFDSFMYLCLVATMTVSVATLEGHSLSKKILILSIITVANFVGQGTGVLIGKKFIKEEK